MGRGFGVTAAVSHEVVRDLAREAERLGYSSFWVNDLPHADGLTSLVAASASTDTIRLGVGVIPLDQRAADVIARQVRESKLPLDRLILGVGSGGRSDSLARVRAGVPTSRERSTPRSWSVLSAPRCPRWPARRPTASCSTG